MNPEMTLLLYLVFGIAVAFALWLRRDDTNRLGDLFQIFSAPFFWPLYLPALLAGRPESDAAQKSSFSRHRSRRTQDALDMAITQVERELDQALKSLEGWAEGVLTEERDRIAELKTAWRQQAQNIREIDELLLQTSTPAPLAAQESTLAESTSDELPIAAGIGSVVANAETSIPTPPLATQDSRVAEHERLRAENISRLTQVRRSMINDLMATVAWVRELVTMIHLAKFTGAPASRAQELVQQIASAVEGLSDATHLSANSAP